MTRDFRSTQLQIRQMLAQCINSAPRLAQSGLMLIAVLTGQAYPAAADVRAPAHPIIDMDSKWLPDAIFREQEQQRLLQTAERHIQAAEYPKALEVIRHLLRASTDSADLRTLPNLAGAMDSIQGIRTAILTLLESLPPSAVRQWNSTYRGLARRLLRQAVSQAGRTQLDNVANKFPMSDVAAEAMFLRIGIALSRGNLASAAASVDKLEAMQRRGLLPGHQVSLLNKLQKRLSKQEHATSGSRNNVGPRWNATHHMLVPKLDWQIQQSPWHTLGGANELTPSGSGHQFRHQFGAQRPLAGPDFVLFRTPAGLSRLNRLNGRPEWFLPFLSTPRDTRQDENAAMRLFHTTPVELRRLERHRSTIYFVDGQPLEQRRQQFGFQNSRSANPGATHLVALHNDTTPQVLWWTQGLAKGEAKSADNRTTHKALQLWPIRQSSNLDNAHSSHRPLAAESGNSESLFQSSPIVRNGRLYITTCREELTSLNCLSARTGELIWQQPLLNRSRDQIEQLHNPAVVGGVVDDVVICMLGKGLIAGCRVADGSIAWLQNILTADSAADGATSFAFASQAEPSFIPAGDTGRSMGTKWLQISGESVICGRQDSPVLFCLDATDGSVRWSASRAVQHGLTSGQYDLSCIGQIERQLIMIGYGHVRALAIEDGSTTWVRPLGNHQGRVAIHDSCIYAGSSAGRLLGIDGNSGTIVSSQPLQHDQMGNVWTVDQHGLLDASAWQLSARSWTRRDAATTPSPVVPFSSPTVSVEYDIESDAILTPALHGSVDSQFAAAESLLSERRRLECELLLLNIRLARGPEYEHSLNRKNQLLQQVRQPFLSPGHVEVDISSAGDAKSAFAQVATRARFEETSSDLSRYALQRFRMLLKRQQTSQLPQVPSWYAHQFLRVTERQSDTGFHRAARGESRLGLVNIGQIQERHSVIATELSFPRSVTFEDAWASPALCVVQKRNSIGVLSLYDPDPLTPRWLQPVTQESSGQVIAMNSHRFVIVNNDGIQALHPLNGRLLWKRQWKDSEETLPMHGQFFKVYQTAEHIILLSSLGTSCVVLDAANGEILRIAAFVPHPISRIVGRQLVFADANGELQIQDLLDGSQRSIGVSQVTQIDNAARLQEGTIMVTTSAPSILFVDVARSKTVTRIDLTKSDAASPGQKDHPLMIHRAGLMFVASTSRDWKSRMPPTAFGEGQIGFGVLVCLHPDTWQLLWHDTCDTAAVPHIYGDPCPYLVLCSSGEYAAPGRSQRSSYVIPDSTTIQVRNAATGRTVGQLHRAASSTPLRVAYNSKHDQLLFTFADTVVRMTLDRHQENR